jgi:Flp pilus assembly protein protease CpaA
MYTSAAEDIISINIENWIIIIIIIISLQLLPRRIAMVGFCLLDHHEK